MKRLLKLALKNGWSHEYDTVVYFKKIPKSPMCKLQLGLAGKKPAKPVVTSVPNIILDKRFCRALAKHRAEKAQYKYEVVKKEAIEEDTPMIRDVLVNKYWVTKSLVEFEEAVFDAVL